MQNPQEQKQPANAEQPAQQDNGGRMAPETDVEDPQRPVAEDQQRDAKKEDVEKQREQQDNETNGG